MIIDPRDITAYLDGVFPEIIPLLRKCKAVVSESTALAFSMDELCPGDIDIFVQQDASDTPVGNGSCSELIDRPLVHWFNERVKSGEIITSLRTQTCDYGDGRGSVLTLSGPLIHSWAMSSDHPHT